MKINILLTTTLLSTLTTASLHSSVQSIISSAQKSIFGNLTSSSNLTASIQIPCCTKPPCPGCPASRGNLTLGLLAISYPQTGFLAFKGNPPGCGEGFSVEDCLRFFQVTLLQLDKPLGIAAEKAGETKKGEGDVRGCGEESSAGECLRYLRGFFEEVRTPLERTLGEGVVGETTTPPVGDTPPISDGPEEGDGGNGYGEGKSEL